MLLRLDQEQELTLLQSNEKYFLSQDISGTLIYNSKQHRIPSKDPKQLIQLRCDKLIDSKMFRISSILSLCSANHQIILINNLTPGQLSRNAQFFYDLVQSPKEKYKFNKYNLNMHMSASIFVYVKNYKQNNLNYCKRKLHNKHHVNLT